MTTAAQQIEHSATPSSARLLCVAPHMAAMVWPMARGLIKSAFDRTEPKEFERTEAEVLAGLQPLWIVVDGAVTTAATTQLVEDNNGKLCVVRAAAGLDPARWMPDIEAYARGEGCTGMRVMGRRGWERKLTGYRPEFVILAKDL